MRGTAAARRTETGSTAPGGMSSASFTATNAYLRSSRALMGGGLPRQSLYMFIDFVTVMACGVVAFGMRFGHFFPVTPYSGIFLLYSALIVLICISQDLYRTPREMLAIQEGILVAKAVVFATAILVVFIFTSGDKDISRLVIVSAGAINVLALSGWRYAKRRYVARRLYKGLGTRRALIIGSTEAAKDLASCFDRNLQLGYVFCGFLDTHPNGNGRVLGSTRDFRQIALSTFADEVFVTSPADRELVKHIFIEAQRLHLNLNIIPDLYDDLGRHAPIRSLMGFPVIALSGRAFPIVGLAAKRVLDIVLSLAALIVCAPILLAAAVWIRLDSPGPICYSAPRVGKKGRQFPCHKLRTMTVHADQEKDQMRKNNERQGPFFKMQSDPRITKSGRWLRKYSVDELPQLLNVLFGDMSLVGPRPHPVDDFERYSFEDFRRLEVKPGMTGLWQTEARLDPAFETSMALDLQYMENWSLWLDLRILFKTLPVVFRGQGQ
jgi:exopolysaccharide biosynthesis polyprenyl glycosylphosphotransferase